MSQQENLDAAAAFLTNFVMAQQPLQQQPSVVAPAQLPQAQTPAALLQQLFLATQQQPAAPAPQQQQQQQQQPQLDPSMAQLVAQALNMAQQHQAPPAASPPMPFHQMPPIASSPPLPSIPQKQHNLAQLLGSLNPSLASALMSNALKQAAPAPDASVLTEQQPAPRVSSLPVPVTWSNGPQQFQQQQRPAPTIHSISKMQRWTLEQLESHAKELTDGGYPIPQAVSILLADSRRKEEKRQAKRIANRKSACTSRARKKAKIDKLMNENSQLRRLEMILSYLPDPVIVISTQGTITFCNAQVERVLRHKINELEGANIEDLMIPRSRGVIKKLIRDMLAAEQELSETSVVPTKKWVKSNNGECSGGDGCNMVSENTSDPAFPMLEVKLNSEGVDAGEDVSDTDDRRLASLGHKNSSFNSNEGDDATPDSVEKEKRNANDNLSKNVEEFKLNTDKAKTEQVRFSHKDDVMGASVTANNADAKLSSLMHEPSLKVKHMMGPKRTAHKQEEQSSSTMDLSISKTSSDKAQVKGGNSSEDSGYRESGESPEDSNSSSSGASQFFGKAAKETGKRPLPIAPSRNVCLIRSDLSTIWCELTSSIRTVVAQYDTDEPKDDSVEEEPQFELENEILLCFRPIQEGEKVSAEMRFSRVVNHDISESSGDTTSSNVNPASTETQLDVNETVQLKKSSPLKKRVFE